MKVIGSQHHSLVAYEAAQNVVPDVLMVFVVTGVNSLLK